MHGRARWFAAGLVVGLTAAVRERQRLKRQLVWGHPEHAARVHRVARQLRERPAGRPISLRKRAVAHQVPKRGDLRRRDHKIDVGELDHILEIDPVARTCIAEPGVTFVDLVEATMRHGLVPYVVPELKTITVGGAVSGCSIESMSFDVGGFHDTCLEYEVVTGDGRVLTCTPSNENALVFQMMHGSFGTLGILTRLKFKLTPARKYVHVLYEHHQSLETYRASILQHARAHDVDFMDGIIHSPTHLVLSVGRFTDSAPYAHKYDWIKAYCETTAVRREDYLRTADYFFRYDRGVTNVHPKSTVARFLFGKFLGSSQALRLAEKANFLLAREKPTIILDVFLPISKMGEFLAWYEREFAYFPLWCVPYRRVHDYEWLSPGFYDRTSDEMFVDLAIYGMKQRGDRNYHRLMEEKLRELGGVKTLISHNYYSPEEFWQTWNRENYDAAKRVTDPQNVFRDLYTKTCKAAMGLEA